MTISEEIRQSYREIGELARAAYDLLSALSAVHELMKRPRVVVLPSGERILSERRVYSGGTPLPAILRLETAHDPTLRRQAEQALAAVQKLLPEVRGLVRTFRPTDARRIMLDCIVLSLEPWEERAPAPRTLHWAEFGFRPRTRAQA